MDVDGCSCIVANGEVVAKGKQFSLTNVDVVFAQLDLDKVHIQLNLYTRQKNPVKFNIARLGIFKLRLLVLDINLYSFFLNFNVWLHIFLQLFTKVDCYD